MPSPLSASARRSSKRVRPAAERPRRTETASAARAATARSASVGDEGSLVGQTVERQFQRMSFPRHAAGDALRPDLVGELRHAPPPRFAASHGDERLGRAAQGLR
ncbi:MAG: hypothetical protein RML45_09060 [Acetobacteraceae bacterium]|nr:hypothetical protein [Acetobacteraceae bacterium]